ncbi:MULTISPECIES: AraC family transcriptional regulator [unclassified Stenotrophomonas]|jgi:AraC-like DNA-binding protein|uniref:AraC family transcriptional regulator n=1 Tax=unclassified Stenotrophomonas TaxID=196198 RepID=UPI001781D152|nr:MULTISPECIES: AraC family transcriptional regulator [unclassified Stenotrophomonas]MBD8643446.1 helix-turn-helix domain-containing protein [Stenotrophomonas sp. CFBP 13724]MDY1032103.1 AraC family transcriptional regulator [Stenotrophomonas sp. CFBP8980]
MNAPRFHVRSYGDACGGDRHDYAQWVLPLHGELQFELDGHGARLDALQGVFVAPGESHDQVGRGVNQHLIIDCDASWFDGPTLEHLRGQRWLSLPQALRASLQALPAGSRGEDLLPLLLQAFAPDGSGARLQALCARMQAAPAEAWPVERMAQLAGLSTSHLHARFLRELGLPPQAWLSALRLRWARHLLRSTQLPISTVAQLAGYSEQSALTRALRRETGRTPAMWRSQPS